MLIKKITIVILLIMVITYPLLLASYFSSRDCMESLTNEVKRVDNLTTMLNNQ